MPPSEVVAAPKRLKTGTAEASTSEDTAEAKGTAEAKVRRRYETIAALRLDEKGAAPREAAVAAEVPVGLVYNGIPHVVMMATPGDLLDFALGFSLSEGILASPAELLEHKIEDGESGIKINLEVPKERLAGLMRRQRNLFGRSGCGICGVDELTQVRREIAPVGRGVAVDGAAIHRALEALPALQSVNRRTGAVHAAAWADAAGEIALVREDVGRHNALDKLIGAMAARAIDPESGFALITSRCSFEMVQKAAATRIPLLVAISAPTTMALRIAEETGVTLVALARRDNITVYTNPGRVAGRVAP
jgi:FdhD protein